MHGLHRQSGLTLVEVIVATVILSMIMLGTVTAYAENDSAALAVEWNETILAVAEKEDGFLTLKGLRTAAMLHLAMHDALAGSGGRYDAYVSAVRSHDADPVAAATSAAFAVAVNQYPDRRQTFREINERGLAKADDRSGAVQLGETVAAAVLESRDGDGWDAEAEYNWGYTWNWDMR